MTDIDVHFVAAANQQEAESIEGDPEPQMNVASQLVQNSSSDPAAASVSSSASYTKSQSITSQPPVSTELVSWFAS